MKESIDEHHGTDVARLRVQIGDPRVFGNQPALEPFDAGADICAATLSVAAGMFLNDAFFVFTAEFTHEGQRRRFNKFDLQRQERERDKSNLSRSWLALLHILYELKERGD